ncbi:MAG: hypothetical protein AAF824_12920 [Bacteroidota bacterium]
MSSKLSNTPRQVTSTKTDIQIKATHIAYGAIVLSILLTVTMVATKQLHDDRPIPQQESVTHLYPASPQLARLQKEKSPTEELRSVPSSTQSEELPKPKLGSSVSWGSMDFSWFSGMGSINWHTSNEQNTRYFEVERSTDAKTYGSIIKLTPSKAKAEYGYSYYDKSLGTLGMPRVYYRIRHVGLDGKEIVSDPIKVDIPAKAGLYARLMELESGHVKVQCAADKSLQMNLKIHNNLGEEILHKSIEANPEAFTLSLKSAKLVEGQYYLTLTDNDQTVVTESFQITD